jgi:hypothetical protein
VSRNGFQLLLRLHQCIGSPVVVTVDKDTTQGAVLLPSLVLCNGGWICTLMNTRGKYLSHLCSDFENLKPTFLRTRKLVFYAFSWFFKNVLLFLTLRFLYIFYNQLVSLYTHTHRSSGSLLGLNQIYKSLWGKIISFYNIESSNS